MYRKMMFFLAILSLAAGFMAGCTPESNTSNVSIQDMLPLLLDKAETIASAPGWLRVTEDVTYDIDQEDLGSLANGKVITLEHEKETWYHINDQGQVYENVIYMRSPDGAEIQVSVYLDNVITNLTTRTNVDQNPYPLGALDYNISTEMQDYMDRTGKEPGFVIKDVDGKEAAILTIEETLETPATTEYYTDPVNGIRTVAYFDMTSGLLFRLERFRIFEDGSERLFYKTDITVDSNVEPTEDVLFLLEGNT